MVTTATRGTRTEALPALAKGVKLPAGYVPAYFRKRNSLAVLRSKTDRAYLVFDISTGFSREVKNTKEASILMSKIAHHTAKLRK
jgi:hypothetical protein